MTYFKLNPTKKEMTNLFDIMDSVLGKDFNLPNTYKSITPAVNVKETENSFVLELVAPGLKKEDLKVEIDKNKLSITYQEEEKSEEVIDKFVRKEFGYQSFKRSFTLPERANKKDITANYTNGILILSISKKEVEAPKQIEIA